MSTSVKKEEKYDLHEDVIVKILCRLPVKSLIRFTSVSKRWRSIIISDPQFAKSQLQLASQQGTLSRKILISICATFNTIECQMLDPFEDVMLWLPSRFQSLADYSTVNNLTFPSENKSQRVMASCNGLVLLSTYQSYYYEDLCIWNPSTAFLRKIPSHSLGFEVTKTTENNKYRSCLCYGFGQVSATDDYKVVFIRPALGDFVDVYVFSLRANVWKVIKAPWSSSTGCFDRHGTLLNEAIHWVNYSMNGVSDPTMVAFDLAEEKLRQVPLPVFNQNEDGVHLRQIRIQGLLGGCLCVSLDLFGHSEFWVMREYGVCESWVKHIQFSRDDLPDVFTSCSSWYPTFVTEAGTVMIKLLDKNELVWIKCRQEENPVCSARYKIEEYPGAIFDATLYDETLVSVPECL